MRGPHFLSFLFAVPLVTLLSGPNAEAALPSRPAPVVYPTQPIVPLPIYNNPYQNMVARQILIQQVVPQRQLAILEQQ